MSTEQHSRYEEDLDAFLDQAGRPADYYEGEYLVGAEAQVVHDHPWRIGDDGAADWAMRKLARAERRIAEIAALASEERERVDAWEQEMCKALVAEGGRWRALLEDYGLRRREETAEATLRLPHGVVRTTKLAEAFSVDDKAALLSWLLDDPALEAAWCQIDLKPQVGRIKPDVAIERAATCSGCGAPIVLGPEQEERAAPRAWVSASGEVCPGTSDLSPHRPVTEEGEVVTTSSVVVYRAPSVARLVPGLAVRAERVNASVQVEQR